MKHADAAAEADRIVRADMERIRVAETRLVIASAMERLAEKVRRLREFESDEPRDSQRRAWNRCVDTVLVLIEDVTP